MGKKKGRGYADKYKVLALVDLTNGRAKSMVVDELKANTLVPILKQNIAKEATVYTDEAAVRCLGREFTKHDFVRDIADALGKVDEVETGDDLNAARVKG